MVEVRNSSDSSSTIQKREKASLSPVYQIIMLTTPHRYSILPALSLDGILDVVVIEGAVNGDIFFRFIEGLLLEMNPYPGKNSVLVMDNVQFHLNDDIQNFVEER